MSDLDLSDAVIGDSNELTAEDLRGGPIVVTIAKIQKNSDPKRKYKYFFVEDVKPWMPCLTMRRVLFELYGNKSSAYIGQSLKLFRDPDAKWQGKKVGGVRISHATGITEKKSVSVQVAQGVKGFWDVEPLTVAYWSDAEFAKMLPKVLKSIEEKRHTQESAIKQMEKTARLTAEQRAQIVAPAQQTDADDILADPDSDTSANPAADTSTDTQNNEELI